MHELNVGGVWSIGREAHVDLRFHRDVWLPLRIDLPEQHESMRRLPVRNGGNRCLRAVVGNLEPSAAKPRLHQHLRDRLLADTMIVRPPACEPARKDLKSMFERRLHANGLAHWRDRYCLCHLPFLLLMSLSTSVWKAAKA